MCSSTAIQDTSRTKFFDSLKKARENLIDVIYQFNFDKQQTKPVNKVTTSDINGLNALEFMEKPFKSLNELIDTLNKIPKE